MRIVVKPLADGGEGTTDALIAGLGGEHIDLTVTGPLGTPVNAHYGYLAEKNTAILEMAAAAGIILVRESEKNPGDHRFRSGRPEGSRGEDPGAH